MSARTLMSLEEYLATPFEWEPEYVRGTLVERPMPNRVHSWIVVELIALLHVFFRPFGLRVESEIRCRMPNGNHRLPDVAVCSISRRAEKVPTTPPLLVVEVLSEDDKPADIREKLEDYALWGVPHIWVVDPQARTTETFVNGRLEVVEALTLPDYGLEIRLAQLMEGLPDFY